MEISAGLGSRAAVEFTVVFTFCQTFAWSKLWANHRVRATLEFAPKFLRRCFMTALSTRFFKLIETSKLGTPLCLLLLGSCKGIFRIISRRCKRLSHIEVGANEHRLLLCWCVVPHVGIFAEHNKGLFSISSSGAAPSIASPIEPFISAASGAERVSTAAAWIVNSLRSGPFGPTRIWNVRNGAKRKEN
ncbi:hypothetical protein DL98DRAFT_299606 [Cadophora sp. DSE1049]|nr:hypothetical protein DL98DRAFT_299606 [Cadophora sp. DSE1049]